MDEKLTHTMTYFRFRVIKVGKSAKINSSHFTPLILFYIQNSCCGQVAILSLHPRGRQQAYDPDVLASSLDVSQSCSEPSPFRPC